MTGEPSPLRSHLARWGLLWLAVVTALLLVGSTSWVRLGITSHSHEFAGVHGSFLLSKRPPGATLEAQLQQMRPYGAWSLSRFTAGGVLQETAGPTSEPHGRAPDGPMPTTDGRYRVEQALDSGFLVVEYVPLLAIDLQARATPGLVLSAVREQVRSEVLAEFQEEP